MIDRQLRRAARPLKLALRAGVDRADANRLRKVADEIVGPLGTWTVQSVRRARSGTRMVVLQASDRATAFLKLTDSADGSALLAREREMLERLVTSIADEKLRAMLPEPMGAGQHGRWAYLLQRAVPGEPATPVLSEPRLRRWLMAEASDVAVRLHGATARSAELTEVDVATWIDAPIRLIRRLARAPARDVDRLDAVGAELRDALSGAIVSLGFVHGDFWSENLLVDRHAPRITGVVDWDSADPANLVAHDLLHLVLYARKLQHGSEIGEVICRALDPRAEWDAAELPAIGKVSLGVGAGARDSIRAALLLYWLRLVSMNHARQPGVTTKRRWVADNVDAVLACV